MPHSGITLRTGRKVRLLKQATVAPAAGLIFSSLTCTSNVANAIGTEMSFLGETGVLGPLGQPVTATGDGVQFFGVMLTLLQGL
jgi:hypothetical protein